MDKTAIKNFAIEARNILMKTAVTEAGFYGVTKDGCKSPIQTGSDFEVYETLAGTENRIYGADIKKRENLVKAIKELGFDQVIEETAYTWFNRIIAIRFMEVNNYLPSRVRVLSSETGSNTPDILSQFDTLELNLTSEELEKIQIAKRDNRYDDAFRLLFVKQCNELNDILPGLFEKINDYMELLLKITYTSDGVVRMLVDTIPEDCFNVETEGQVEIIGWLYQFYNTEQNELVYDGSYAKEKVSKELLPAATTIYTPDWVVRYMVENSLGEYWIRNSRGNDVFEEWKYYIKHDNTVFDSQSANIEDIKFIDPCMGSGHILVYAFELFMQIYVGQGYSERDAAKLILENNIFGADIDNRAYQMAYFALFMKARFYNRRIFSYKISPNLIAIPESKNINREHLKFFGNKLDEGDRIEAKNQITRVITDFENGKDIGSIIKKENVDWNLLFEFIEDHEVSGQMSIESYGLEETVKQLFEVVRASKILSSEYEVVVTNPPYLGSSRFNPKLEKYVKSEYPDEKADLSMVMYKKAVTELVRNNGFVSFVTTSSWMYLSSFENLRRYLISNKSFVSIVDFGTELFDGKVGHNPIVAWTICNNRIQDQLKAVRLVDFCYSRRNEKEQEFFNPQNTYCCNQNDFVKIPSSPIAYWLGNKVFSLYENGKTMEDVAHPKVGMQTSNNDKYLRLWFEVDYSEFNGNSEGLKWIKYLKGGAYRKWYGNLDYLLDYNYDPNYILQQKNARVLDLDFLEKPKVTWTDLTSGSNSFRYAPRDTFYDISGHCFFPSEDDQMWLLAYANSNIFSDLKKVFNSTFHCQVGDVAKIVVPNLTEEEKKKVTELAERCVKIVKDDWDSSMNSWDFKKHPLVTGERLIEHAYLKYKKLCEDRRLMLRESEEEINKIFISSLGLEGEAKYGVDEKDISYMHVADVATDIKSLLSYAVGCMFGRYSLDEEGIIYAGGEWQEERYVSFKPDKDNIIPITDEPYLNDDIIVYLEKWLGVAFSQEYLEENLDFIANAIGKKHGNARDIIRQYFLGDFWKDHYKDCTVAVSGKRPIYWMFDSGSQNGFKCLIYLHRYNRDTVGLIRSDYLTKVQAAIENALKNAEYNINNSDSSVDRALATKKRDRYIKQLAEIHSYYPALSHIALQRIDISLNDGVKANYAKFQGIEVSIEGEKKQKVDLLAKI